MGLLPQSRLIAVSSYYETQPVDPHGVLGTTWFYNGVVKIETQLSPQRLLEILRETESALGREDENRHGPRTIDFDLLLYGQQIMDEPDLKIPHPRMHLRGFVLEPLVELAPEWVHPILKNTVTFLRDQLDDPHTIRKLDLAPGSRFGGRPSCSLPLSS